ncbi:MAG: hypothetical protein Q8P73_02155 [bacterium]|nr:hypothetical protein [bacterium]
MSSKLPEHVTEWFTKAADDELSIRSLLEHKDGAPGTVCYLNHCRSGSGGI